MCTCVTRDDGDTGEMLRCSISLHTCQDVVSNIWTCCVTDMNESCYTYNRVYFTRTKEYWHTYARGMSVWARCLEVVCHVKVAPMNESCLRSRLRLQIQAMTLSNVRYHMSRMWAWSVWMSHCLYEWHHHVAHVNESCHRPHFTCGWVIA